MTDPLQDAVNALRETTSGEESGSARYTRARVLGTVRLQKRRRVIHVAFALPLAAILIGSAAWATSDQHLPAFVQRVSVALGLSHAPPASSRRVKSPAVAHQPAQPSSTPSPVAPIKPAVARENAVETGLKRADLPPDTSLVGRSANNASSTVPKPIKPSVPLLPRDSHLTEVELSLYESAHHAHFVTKDYGTALTAWQEYLRLAPHGRFTVEANYNRALCLLRLGQTQAAREALEPFAKGVYGNYRQAEASALLGQLD